MRLLGDSLCRRSCLGSKRPGRGKLLVGLIDSGPGPFCRGLGFGLGAVDLTPMLDASRSIAASTSRAASPAPAPSPVRCGPLPAVCDGRPPVCPRARPGACARVSPDRGRGPVGQHVRILGVRQSGLFGGFGTRDGRLSSFEPSSTGSPAPGSHPPPRSRFGASRRRCHQSPRRTSS